MNHTEPLIAPKPIWQYSAEEYWQYVVGMYQLRVKRSSKPTSPVSGLTMHRTKRGGLSVRRSKLRAFEYVTMSEIAALAKHMKCNQAEVWNEFKRREYIIARDRMEAEQTYAKIKEMPW